jgi:hypothetical protein
MAERKTGLGGDAPERVLYESLRNYRKSSRLTLWRDESSCTVVGAEINKDNKQGKQKKKTRKGKKELFRHEHGCSPDWCKPPYTGPCPVTCSATVENEFKRLLETALQIAKLKTSVIWGNSDDGACTYVAVNI